MSRFDFALSDSDIEATRKLMIHCADMGLEYFSSDDFREAGLDADMADPQHDIGSFFAKLKANGIAEPVGEIPSEIGSNNLRKVDLWRWCWERWRMIVHSRLEAFT